MPTVTLFNGNIKGIYLWALTHISVCVSFFSMQGFTVDVLNTTSLRNSFDKYLANMYEPDELDQMSDQVWESHYNSYIGSLEVHLIRNVIEGEYISVSVYDGNSVLRIVVDMHDNLNIYREVNDHG